MGQLPAVRARAATSSVDYRSHTRSAHTSDTASRYCHKNAPLQNGKQLHVCLSRATVFVVVFIIRHLFFPFSRAARGRRVFFVFTFNNLGSSEFFLFFRLTYPKKISTVSTRNTTTIGGTAMNRRILYLFYSAFRRKLRLANL